MSNNPGWTGNVPYRTGVPSILTAARLICRLLAVYTPVIKTFLDVNRHVYVDALNQACSDFVANIEPPRN